MYYECFTEYQVDFSDLSHNFGYTLINSSSSVYFILTRNLVAQKIRIFWKSVNIVWLA